MAAKSCKITFQGKQQEIKFESEELPYGALKDIVRREMKLFPLQEIFLENLTDLDDNTFIKLPDKLTFVPFNESSSSYFDNSIPNDLIKKFKDINGILNNDEYEIVFKIHDKNKPFSEFDIKDIFSSCYFVKSKDLNHVTETKFDCKIFERVETDSLSIAIEDPNIPEIEVNFIAVSDHKLEKTLNIPKLIQKSTIFKIIENKLKLKPSRAFLKNKFAVVEIVDGETYNIQPKSEILIVTYTAIDLPRNFPTYQDTKSLFDKEEKIFIYQIYYKLYESDKKDEPQENFSKAYNYANNLQKPEKNQVIQALQKISTNSKEEIENAIKSFNNGESYPSKVEYYFTASAENPNPLKFKQDQ